MEARRPGESSRYSDQHTGPVPEGRPRHSVSSIRDDCARTGNRLRRTLCSRATPARWKGCPVASIHEGRQARRSRERTEHGALRCVQQLHAGYTPRFEPAFQRWFDWPGAGFERCSSSQGPLVLRTRFPPLESAVGSSPITLTRQADRLAGPRRAGGRFAPVTQSAPQPRGCIG